MFHGHWKKIFTLLLLDGVSCKCWLDPVVGEVFNSLISLLIFCLVALSIVKRTMMKSLTIYLFCFIYFASNVASEFIFMIVIASCWIDPFISISPLSLTLAIFFFCFIYAEQRACIIISTVSRAKPWKSYLVKYINTIAGDLTHLIHHLYVGMYRLVQRNWGNTKYEL